MVSISEIKNAADNVRKSCPIKSMSLFGSYAEGTADMNSDVDILVEINKEAPSLIDIGFIQYQMQQILKSKVDVLPLPLRKGTRFRVSKTVKLI
jgi:uncharacterized protein